jgi:hypothetical protein
LAHPDVGYLIPDELWEGQIDSETGENFYRDDTYAPRRLASIKEEMQRKGTALTRRKPLEQIGEGFVPQSKEVPEGDLHATQRDLIIAEIATMGSQSNQRCPRCNGVGAHWGGYCTCKVGRDLRRLEVGRGPSYNLEPEI